ncbi:MAG: threonylcarbamoyl-AMP synthase [bacterium]|nr:threonylcarbamoyl-AMP synthase [bacterium]
MTKILKINKDDPGKDAVNAALAELEKGNLIIYPTETLYGIGADCSSDEALKKVFEVKKRERSKPIPLIASTMEMVCEYSVKISDTAKILADEFWPGPLTMIFEASTNVNEIITGGTGTVGFRIPPCRICTAIAESMGNPVTATSANLSGSEGCRSIDEIDSGLKNDVSLILDGGLTKSSLPSTILSLVSDQPVLIRQGFIEIRAVESVLGCRISKI